MSSSPKTRTIFVASCDQGNLRKSSQTDPIADEDYSSRKITTGAEKGKIMQTPSTSDKARRQCSPRTLSASGHGNVKTILVSSCNTRQGIFPASRDAVSLDDEQKSISPSDNKHIGHGQIAKEQKEDKTQPRPDGPSNAHKDDQAADVLTIEDLDDVCQEFSVSKHNQTQTEGNPIHPNNVNEFNMPAEKTIHSPNNNLDQKGKNEGEPVSNEAKDHVPAGTTKLGKEFQETNTEEERGTETSLSLEEITLSEDINLPYSRYNGKSKALIKNNVKPGRPDIKDGKDKTKKKIKKSKKKDRVDEEESYQITMVGHMPQISMTNAFNAKGDNKHTIKKENKKEILERIRKGGVIYKLFNKPTKVKKFKIKKDKAEVQQQDEKKTKGFRKSLQRFIGNIRNAFRSCTCSCF